MTQQFAINPYAPPKANLDAPVEATTVQAFPRFSAWGVFLLSGVTLGVYPVYWLYTRTRILNRLLPSNPIPKGLAFAAVVLLLGNAAGSFLEGIYPGNLGVRGMSSLIGLAFSIVNLCWVFMFRNRVNEHCVSHKGDRYWLGGVLTFFFQVLYLQYKLNELIDQERTVTSLRPIAAA